jgi:DNA-binding HxlR family transcriptional regulator
MKSPIEGLHKEFENRIKLGIMSILAANEAVEFNELKKVLKVTDGNLASHIKSLEKNGYVSTHKYFSANKPKSEYSITPIGKSAFSEHIAALHSLIQSNKN